MTAPDSLLPAAGSPSNAAAPLQVAIGHHEGQARAALRRFVRHRLALIGAVVAEFVAGTSGRSSGLAYEILQAGFALDIPRMFAAMLLITAAGVALFSLMVALSKLALGAWHESEVGVET